MNETLASLLGMLPSPVIEAIVTLRKMNIRQLMLQFLNFATMILTAFMLYKGFSVVTNNGSPATVVLSYIHMLICPLNAFSLDRQSMFPAFSRGDILFLTMSSKRIECGDITVFSLKGHEIPIVHRVLKVHEDANGKIKALTKGDNNDVHDRGLYNRGQLWLENEHFVGRVRVCVPFLGMVTILLNDYPKLKQALLGGMFFFALLTRE